MPFYYFFYKETNQNIYHYIAHMIQYHVTLSLTNNIPLQLGFFPEIRPITKNTTHQS